MSKVMDKLKEQIEEIRGDNRRIEKRRAEQIEDRIADVASRARKGPDGKPMLFYSGRRDRR